MSKPKKIKRRKRSPGYINLVKPKELTMVVKSFGDLSKSTKGI